MKAVVVRQLGYRFAGGVAQAIENVSFELEQGTWNLVAGRTGSGKSTLLRALCGLIPHHASGTMQGSVNLFEHDTRGQSAAQLARLVGLVLQSADDQLCTTTPTAEIAFGLENLCWAPAEIGRRVAEVLDASQLGRIAPLRNDQLSGGQKQRLVLASVMAPKPRVLLLDEPLSQLDHASGHGLLQELDRLRRDGVTIVMVEHRLEEAIPFADRILLMDEGRLAASVPADDTMRLAEEFAAIGLELPDIVALATRLNLRAVRSVEDFSQALELQYVPHPERTTIGSVNPNRHVESVASAPALMEARGLSLRFDSATAPLWHDLSFVLREGETVALIGPNGAGKSSLLAVLAGLTEPSEGEIRWPATASKRPPRGCGSQVALLLQNPDLMLFCHSVRDELAFGPRQQGCSRNEVAERVDELARQMSIKMLLDQPPLALSQGQRLRTAMAAALSLGSPLLLLDEPTTGQDPRQILQLMTAIAAESGGTRRRCLLFSTHDLRTAARFAQRVLVLAEGRLLADCTPDELLADDALLEAARLSRPPLCELRNRHGLRGRTVAELAAELQG